MTPHRLAKDSSPSAIGIFLDFPEDRFPISSFCQPTQSSQISFSVSENDPPVVRENNQTTTTTMMFTTRALIALVALPYVSAQCASGNGCDFEP